MCFVQGAECNLSVVVFDLLQVTQSAHMAKRINDNQTSVSVCVCVCVCAYLDTAINLHSSDYFMHEIF